MILKTFMMMMFPLIILSGVPKKEGRKAKQCYQENNPQRHIGITTLQETDNVKLLALNE